ncbi:G-type lectin S-receptor-like serine/threonine-protein kinase RKS1 isoform X2 [Medicago truncatula]|uniref:G-type lectin S-receptor-like serine/threonine-protein kinase RKS1 isoform X2 n=1 Tax=Medicago truncatula TaxID=3880 RepID=UPI0019675981|nr:G-type lectin S-receptor-like serine/threonine-protein kinase RKS1 isoform X2 [Medicago truncatula]
MEHVDQMVIVTLLTLMTLSVLVYLVMNPNFHVIGIRIEDGTGGCVRKKGSSVCENGEGFIKVVSLKVPDTSVAVAKSGLSLEECEKECLQNCSCTAYSIADVRNGGSGCLAWHGDLIDIQKLNDQGQDLFLRVDKIELANYYRKRKGVLDKKRLAAILVASIIAIVLLLSCVNYMWKKKREGKSTSRYVGIWYNNLPIQTVVWVANRDAPINDTSGILSINQNGNLELHHNLSTIPIWSTNVSLTLSQRNITSAVIAKLTDKANIVLMINNTKTVIWESFDHPTDTFLPYQRFGFDRKTNQSWPLQSWKTEDDPGKGAFTVKFSSIGIPQLFMYNHNLPWWRGGHWNGALFVGIPNMKRDLQTFNASFVEEDNYVALSYDMFDKSVIARLVVQQSGFIQIFTWNNQKSQWNRFWSEPTNQCDNYGTCGSNSNCDPLNFENFKCTCLLGFEPKFPSDWYESRDGSGGCVRKKGASVCGNGEGFIKVVSLKVPDISGAVTIDGLSLDECEKECLRNCSCTSYAVADVRNGGSGCLAWHGDLMDIQKLSDQGQDLYLRVDKVELANYNKKSKGVLDKKRLAVIMVVSIVAIVILLSCVNYMWKKKRKVMQQSKEDYSAEENDAQSTTHPNLPFFSLKTIMSATRYCSHQNKLGKGGFGSVYKGCLVNGQEIAVKRLSKESGQGKVEFKNEITLLVKLQHRNLVRLLGCCFEKEERMLVYEYLPNKSLDFFIFDQNQRSSLDWGKRFEIICGIARGVLYLHQDSRLKIIHRDLKASNVLLDAEMNPKISDFGMARIFGEDEIQARTKRVVGTYGYMSPEYAMEGRYSTKSDVFSYGVLLLEIIAGKRNTHCEIGRDSPNLIGHKKGPWI